MSINWYPGHMVKAKREMESNLKLVDLCIQVLDARAPLATQNPDLKQMFANKPILTVLNKADLADAKITEGWIEHFKQEGIALSFNATSKSGNKNLLDVISAASAPIVERYKNRGANKVIRVMVVGIPNVGKSSIINALSKSARAKTGAKPGLTRGKQWVKLTPYLELMDTPGVLWPKLDDQQAAQHLAYIYAIRDEVLDQHTIAYGLAAELYQLVPHALQNRYSLDMSEIEAEKHADNPEELGWAIVQQIAINRGFVQSGGAVDDARAQRVLIDEFRQGKLGRISLESPQEQAE